MAGNNLSLSADETRRRPRLTCADRDGANKLLPPAAAPDHQGQVCLLDQLVHRALQTGAGSTKEKVSNEAQKNKKANGFAARVETFTPVGVMKR